MPLKEILWVVLGIALVISLVTDAMTRRILDVVSLPAIAISLGLRLWFQGLGDLEHGFVSGLVSGIGSAGLFALLARKGKGFGWGDVKLMGAVGAAFGYPLVMAALVFISLVGALQALITLLWQGETWLTLQGFAQRWGARLKVLPKQTPPPTRHIPYGIAIALGSFWAMWWDQPGVVSP